MKAITKKLLVASVAVGILTPFSCNTVYAENINVNDDAGTSAVNSSNNSVTINENNYSIGDTTTTLSTGDTYNKIWGGKYWYINDSGNFSYYENSTGNVLNIYGGSIRSFALGGAAYNSSNNTVNFSGGTIPCVLGAYGYFQASGNNVNISGGYINYVAGAGSILIPDVANDTDDISSLAENDNGIASDNTVTITDGEITGAVVGAVGSESVTGNIVNINGGRIYGAVGGGVGYTAYTLDDEGNISRDNRGISGTVENNTVNINGGTITASENLSIPINSEVSVVAAVIGGIGNSANNNTIKISDGTITGDIIGGVSDGSSSSYNEINITGGTVGGNVYGGFTISNSANNNVVNISDNANIEFESSYGGINGGYGDTAENNEVNISGGNVNLTEFGIIRGGYGDTSASGNTVNITNGTVNAYGLIGGGYGTVENNTVNISGGTVNIEDEIRGGEGDTVNGNTVNISGGTVTAQNIFGGWGEEVSNNTVDINGGTVSGNIFAGGGYSSITDNTINISGSPNLTNAWLYGYVNNQSEASVTSSITASGNTLNISTKNLTAQNIGNFDNLNFYIQNDVANGDTLLTLTSSEGTDLSGFAIKAGVVSGNENLQVGDTINLLTNSSGLTTNSGTTYGMVAEGVSLDYTLEVSRSGNSIVANVTDIASSKKSETFPLSSVVTGLEANKVAANNSNLPESISDEFESQTADDSNLTETASDDFENQNEDDSSETSGETSETTAVEPKGYEIFMNMGGGSLRTKAGNGSYVDMTTRSINLGFARSFQAASGRFTIAPIIDYANGSYDSYLEGGTHSSGNTKYIAGGLIARRMLQNGFYYETSARVGKIKTDFASSDLTNSNVTYNTSATALSGHLKLGKAFRLNKNNLLDVYGTYHHSHQNGMGADLSTGGHYDFSSADSGRLRLGYRLTTRTSKISQIYTGLAFQYENSSGVTATYEGYTTPSAGESGSSGMLELGWIVKPLKALPWAVDINTTGWVGHQRGVTAFAKIQKSF